jgi:predicted membrane protein
VRRLGNARFEEASINGGIGELKVDFGGELLHEARAEIDLDIGETEIEVPGDVGVRLSTSRLWFLSQAELPHDYHRDGYFYYSANYDTAAKELLLRLKPGIGEARMVQQ